MKQKEPYDKKAFDGSARARTLRALRYVHKLFETHEFMENNILSIAALLKENNGEGRETEESEALQSSYEAAGHCIDLLYRQLYAVTARYDKKACYIDTDGKFPYW